MAKNSPVNWFVIGIGGMFVVALLILAAYMVAPFEGCIGVVKIDGELISQDIEPTLFYSGVKGSESIAAEIGEADKRSDVKAVVLLIDSPGGSVVASRQVYGAVAGLKKPSVAYINELAASGGYYVAAGADEVVANPDAIIGSIGSRMTFLEMSGLFEKLGVNETVIKSGAMKDIGSPAREMTPDERASLELIVNESFAQFVSDIRAGRGSRLNSAEFEKVLDARLLSGRQAKKIGLVDGLGGKKDALKAAARLANITAEEPEICELSGKERQGGIFGSLSSQALSLMMAQAGIPRLSYR